ncbi:MAG: hypothetical protein NWE89_09490 [Candidatus Bathyarchaeota archaeon]|nr:hypothetical protein [Candidatus Bathyarchaeota archaeon]
MNLSEMDQREKTVLLVALALVTVVFAVAAYSYINPPITVWEVKVFESFQNNGKTTILSYGEGKLRLIGLYEFEVDATYRITYKSRSRNLAYEIINIEKIG